MLLTPAPPFYEAGESRKIADYPCPWHSNTNDSACMREHGKTAPERKPRSTLERPQRWGSEARLIRILRT